MKLFILVGNNVAREYLLYKSIIKNSGTNYNHIKFFSEKNILRNTARHLLFRITFRDHQLSFSYLICQSDELSKPILFLGGN